MAHKYFRPSFAKSRTGRHAAAAPLLLGKRLNLLTQAWLTWFVVGSGAGYLLFAE